MRARLLATSGLFLAFLSLQSFARQETPPKPSINRKVLISDLHLGPGRDAQGHYLALEDFRFESAMSAFLKSVGEDGKTDLIIAGDLIDFWQINPELDHQDTPYNGPVEEVSLARFQRAAEQHREVFQSLAAFLAQGSNRVIIVPGNHDAELVFPKVQAELAKTIGVPWGEKLKFAVNGIYEDAGVHVEHGQRFDPLNDTGDQWIFTDPAGTKRIASSWGSLFVKGFFNRVEARLPFIDNLYPEQETVRWAMQNEPLQDFLLPGLGSWAMLLIQDGKLKKRAAAMIEAARASIFLNQQAIIDASMAAISSQLPEKDPTTQKLKELASDPKYADDRKRLIDEVLEAAKTEVARPLPSKSEGFIDTNGAYAHDILSANPKLRVIAFGHTHEKDRPIDTFKIGDHEGWYVNTGCWQRTLGVDEAKRRNIPWEKLNVDDPAQFPNEFTYVVVEYHGDQPVRPKRMLWK